MGDPIDLLADVIVSGVCWAIERESFLVVSFVVVFGYKSGAYVRHASASIFSIWGDVDMFENGVLEGA